MGRFVRISTLGFTLFSVFYWGGVAAFVQILQLVDEQRDISDVAHWASTAIPAIIYGLLCALFLQWFARGIVRRISNGKQN